MMHFICYCDKGVMWWFSFPLQVAYGNLILRGLFNYPPLSFLSFDVYEVHVTYFFLKYKNVKLSVVTIDS